MYWNILTDSHQPLLRRRLPVGTAHQTSGGGEKSVTDKCLSSSNPNETEASRLRCFNCRIPYILSFIYPISEYQKYVYTLCMYWFWCVNFHQSYTQSIILMLKMMPEVIFYLILHAIIPESPVVSGNVEQCCLPNTVTDAPKYHQITRTVECRRTCHTFIDYEGTWAVTPECARFFNGTTHALCSLPAIQAYVSVSWLMALPTKNISMIV